MCLNEKAKLDFVLVRFLTIDKTARSEDSQFRHRVTTVLPLATVLSRRRNNKRKHHRNRTNFNDGARDSQKRESSVTFAMPTNANHAEFLQNSRVEDTLFVFTQYLFRGLFVIKGIRAC